LDAFSANPMTENDVATMTSTTSSASMALRPRALSPLPFSLFVFYPPQGEYSPDTKTDAHYITLRPESVSIWFASRNIASRAADRVAETFSACANPASAFGDIRARHRYIAAQSPPCHENNAPFIGKHRSQMGQLWGSGGGRV
jgi:hypothetical protein